MGAKNCAIGGKRSELWRQLPLETPLGINVSVIQGICNLKCEYCQQSVGGFGDYMKIDVDLIKRRTDELRNRNIKIKQILLGGGGEPCLHPRIAELIGILKDSEVFEQVVLVTNGTLIDNEMAIRLVNSRVDTIRISLNGLTEEDYRKYTGTSIDFEFMKKNLKYLYDISRNKVNIYIKIMDYMLDSEKKRELFREVTQYSDQYSIEQVYQASKEINYEHMLSGKALNIHGADKHIFTVCPIPFYSMTINTDGTVSTCCEAGIWHNPHKLIIGNLYEESILDIWSGKKFNQIRMKILNNINNLEICSKCDAKNNVSYEEDKLDDYKDILLSFYN